MEGLILEDWSAWTLRDVIALIGAILIVHGLSNLAGVGTKKEGSNLSRTDASQRADDGS